MAGNTVHKTTQVAAVSALETDVRNLWELTRDGGASLRWNTDVVGLHPEQMGRLLVVEHTLPYIAVGVLPAVDGRLVDNEARIVPVASRHTRPLSEHPLRHYEVRKFSRDSNLPQPKSMDEIFSMLNGREHVNQTLVPGTPVLDVVAFLPTNSAAYETNFTPILASPNGQYAFHVVVQDRMVSRALLTSLQPIPLYDDRDGNSEAPYFKADSIAQLSAPEQLMLPENRGRMVVVAVPVQEKPKFSSPYLFGEEHSHSFGGSARSFSMKSAGPRTRSAQADDVDIRTGADSGARLTSVEVVPDPSRKPVVYHLRLVGITPDADVGLVSGLCAAMSKGN